MNDETVSKSLKNYFLKGLFVIVPAGVTIFSIGWVVLTLDRGLGFLAEKVLGFRLPGLGLVLALALIVTVGVLMSNYLVRQVFDYFEEGLLRIPGVRAVYKTIKVMAEMFSPGNEKVYRNVVLVEYPSPGSWSLGFVTSRMTCQEDGRPDEKRVTVYVPTNHLYLGNTVVVPETAVRATDISVQDGIQIVLSGGAGFPEKISMKKI